MDGCPSGSGRRWPSGDNVQGAALLSKRLLPGMKQGAADWGPCWDLMAESGLCKNLSLPSPPPHPAVHCSVCQSGRWVLLSGAARPSHQDLLAACWKSSPNPGVQGQAGGKLQMCFLHPTPILFCEASVEVEKEAIHLYMPKLRNASLTTQGCSGKGCTHCLWQGKGCHTTHLSLQPDAMLLRGSLLRWRWSLPMGPHEGTAVARVV